MDANGNDNDHQVLHEDEAETTPSKKDTKYDRQLRLWGVAGQKALMESHILLVNAGEERRRGRAWEGKDHRVIGRKRRKFKLHVEEGIKK